MAASYVNVDINGVQKEAIVVDGANETQRVILKEQLSKFDQEVMDAVSAETGASFFEKLEAHTMKNGLTADVVYADFIVNRADYSAAVAAAKLGPKDAEQDAAIADLIDRVVVLETP